MLVYGTFSNKHPAAFQKRSCVVVTFLFALLFFTAGCNKLKDSAVPQILSISHSSPPTFNSGCFGHGRCRPRDFSFYAKYTFDNTGPTISNLHPATGAPPTTINVTYNENILASSVATADYTISGSCLMLPTVSVSSVSGNVVTISLSGAVCVSNQTVQVSTNAASVTDLLGNAGAGSSSVTYTQP